MIETMTRPASGLERSGLAVPAIPDVNRFERAFARASGAEPVAGNFVRLLLDSSENFPAWLAAIRGAQRYILFEMYIVSDDRVGRMFVDALAERARAGVQVYVVYDWLGSLWARKLWVLLRAAGVHVAGFNPPSFDSPLAWLTRDHRKSIVVDDEVGFVSGLCVSCVWEGNATKRLEPWRDTGVEIRGGAVADLVRAFDVVWLACGRKPLQLPHHPVTTMAGTAIVRVIAGVPNAAGAYRTDLLVASVAHDRLWLTDAYFVATSAYTQALRAAAKDGVDVRLLVPGASDIPAVSPLSRAGYRPLLEAGVRVFEWNGTMLHAKTAVADGLWSRVGSTNLNLASWMSNYELDVAVEDVAFAKQMEAQYERDLERATEVVLTRRNRVRRAAGELAEVEGAAHPNVKRAKRGSAARAVAGAASVGSALGAALTNRRTLGPAEAGLLGVVATATVCLALFAFFFPRALAWPIAFVAGWIGLAWGVKGWVLWLRARRLRAAAARRVPLDPAGGPPG